MFERLARYLKSKWNRKVSFCPIDWEVCKSKCLCIGCYKAK